MNGNWPENVVPVERRNTMNVQGSYDTGEVRDGHKLVREEDGTIDVIHPDACTVGEEDWGDGLTVVSTSCPWTQELDWCAGPRDLHAFDDSDSVLPLDKEVEVTWRARYWRSWTDYGFEGDSEFSWWVER